jgi:excisionase family DNA binding protein
MTTPAIPSGRAALVIPTPEESPTVPLDLAAEAFGIGDTTSYKLAHEGRLADGVPVIRVGSKFRVPTAALRRALCLDVVTAENE